jgi:hypothetical protein
MFIAKRHWRLLAFAAVFAGGPLPAHADKIDGNWCAPDGRRFTIEGPSIVTEEGLRVQGQYTRHAFAYLIPEPSKSAGQKVSMLLLNENTVNLWTGEAGAAPIEVWKRCDVTS